MTKGTLLALGGLLAAASSLCAQENAFDTITSDSLRLTGEVNTASALALDRPDLFRNVNGSLLIHDLPTTVLLNGRRLSIGGDSGRFGGSPLERIPVAFLRAARVYPAGSVPSSLAADAPGGVIDLQTNNYTSGGEIGVFYGGSGGKYGREDFQAYILGGVGNEKLQISAGASYQESSGRGVTFNR